MIRHAIVRQPGENLAEGLTTVDLGVPDRELVRAQHQAYCSGLAASGVEVIRLPIDREHPDSTFVEDTAVLTRKAAILTRPGAPSRLGEVEGIRDAIGLFFPAVHEILAPGTLDGGDVCEAGHHFFIGISDRTNEEGAKQLARIVEAQGYAATTVDIRPMNSILHLKSGIAHLGHSVLLVMEELAGREEFAGFEVIPVPPEETYACNCVEVNDRLLVPAGFPGVQKELQCRGYHTVPLEMSEFRKMDGGLSCLSLRF